MASLRKRGKVWYYRFSDADGIKREKRGCSDRKATEELARQAESNAARTREGLSDPKAERAAREARRPIAEHLADFHADLVARGSTGKHSHMMRAHVARIIEKADVARVSDLSPSAVQSALKALRDDDLSLQTLNHGLRAVKGFSRWLRKDGRTRDDALADMTGFNVATDRRHDRRAFTIEELHRLIQAAERGPVVIGMTGPDRAMVYRVAAGTGLRANELRTLTPESFALGATHPTIVVKAGYSKHRKEDVQPIAVELADALHVWLAGKAPGCPVFGLPEKTADMLREDLEAAGIAYSDDSGRFLDFHAFRHTYVSALAMSSAPVKVVQTLARHSDPKLTLNVYSHLTVFDTASALTALPDLTGSPSSPEAVRMTGTDATVAHHLPTTGNSSRLIQTHQDALPELSHPAMTGQIGLEIGGFDASDRIHSHQCAIPSSEADKPSYRTTEPKVRGSNPLGCNDLRLAATPLAHSLPTAAANLPSDLALIVERWESLPEAVRTGIVAMVKASAPGKGGPRRPGKGLR